VHDALDRAQVQLFPIVWLVTYDSLHIKADNSVCHSVNMSVCLSLQGGWQQHWFPYKLGMYRKTLLTEPVCVTRMDYQALLDRHTPYDAALNQALETVQTELRLVQSGVCHCAAMWVDFEVTSETSITHWVDDGSSSSGNSCSQSGSSFNFPPYLKTHVKFFAAGSGDDMKRFSSSAGVGRSVVGGDQISCTAEWRKDQAIIDLDFEF
jgi:hypothetical protein